MRGDRGYRCDVSVKCKMPVYVRITAPEVPGCEITDSCRRHVHMAIDVLIGLTETIGIEGV